MSTPEWDDETERLRHALEESANRHARAVTEQMESALTETPDKGPVPMPGEVHPAYAGHAFVLDWVNGLHYADRHQILLPRPTRARAWTMGDEIYPTEPSPPPVILTLRKAAGPAPYVGRPFCYTWDVAVDEWDRGVASEARIHYTVDEWTWRVVYGGSDTP